MRRGVCLGLSCRLRGPCSWLLSGETNMLFFDGIGDLGGSIEKVEILAYRPGIETGSVAKRIVIESIACFLQMVTKPIVCFFEL